MKKVKNKKRPYVEQYDSIIRFNYKGKDGWYYDGHWFKKYKKAFKFRDKEIICQLR